MADEQEHLRDPETDLGGEEGAPEDTQRLTAQWSVEDEEEAARERRRRERERQLRSQAEEGFNGTITSSETGVAVQESKMDGKPSGSSELEEDEGFSDWSQKLEQRRQKWAGEGSQGGEQFCHGEWRACQQAEPPQCEGSPRSPRPSFPEDGSLAEAEVKLEQIHLSQESPTFIRFDKGPSQFLKFVAGSDSIDLSKTELEEQRKLSDTFDVAGENQNVTYEFQAIKEEENSEEEKQEDKKRRWNEDEELPEKRQRAPSTSSQDEEYQAPLSPTQKITDRTESLNRSVQKSNSVKKSQPPLPVSKIDDKLEQYTHAIETSSKTPKALRQLSIDLPTNSTAVASTKSFWETGEQAQSSTKTPACKDIVAGDIVNKRSLWEAKESPKPDENAKVKVPGKKYKYVAVGHGQYKRVSTEDDVVTEK